MIEKLKNLKLPVIVGLVLGGLDLAFWIFFLTHWFLNRQELYLSEGLFGMMIIHFPASLLLPLLGGIIIFVSNLFFPESLAYLAPQTILLFIVGVAQYYFVGYFVGWLVSKLRRRFGNDKSIPESKTESKPNRLKTCLFNILYLLFTVLVLQMISDIVSGMLLDFEMYKVNYPPTRHYLEAVVFILWLYSTYRIIRHNKRQEIVKNANRVLLIISG